jgi:hypothetical protein
MALPADEDNFDIDIYGDGEGDGVNEGGTMDFQEEDEELQFNVDIEEEGASREKTEAKPETEKPDLQQQLPQTPSQETKAEVEGSTAAAASAPAPPSAPQGVKRKDLSDERPLDHNATNALMISDLHWWTTEDHIRGWLNEAGAEAELKDLTFSEHKVNGKSKGLVTYSLRRDLYQDLTLPQTSISGVLFATSGDGSKAQDRVIKWQPAQCAQALGRLYKCQPKPVQDVAQGCTGQGQR